MRRFRLPVCCFAILCLASAPPISAQQRAGGGRPDLPLLVGGHAHGAANISALKQLGLGNFVWIPKQGYGMGNTPWNAQHDVLADVDACKAAGMYFMVSQRRGLGREFKPGGPEYGGDTTPEIHAPAMVRDFARRAGDLFVGLHSEELDADLLQNGLRASSRSRTPDLYEFTDRPGGRRVFEGELRRMGGLAHAAGARFMPNLCVSLHHSGFRAGGDIVMAELLESLPTTELQLAYLRGGAEQFGKPWGVWVSPWHRGLVPTEDKTLWPGPNSAVGAGHDASRFRRCLYLAWASGARVLTVQETEQLLSGDGRGGHKLASWGKELKAFWDFARANPEPVTPCVQLGLMVDADSGWAPGHLHGDWIEHQTVWGKLPPERGDAMLAGYLDALLPGFERKTGWWKPEGSEYPGYFAPTPAGPFDIVSSDVAVERLRHYKAIAVMGDIAMTPRLLRTLRAYVRTGGTLHINVNQMRLRERFVQAADFLGATIGETRQRSEWSKSNLLMRRTTSADRIVRKAEIGALTKTEWPEPWFVVQDVQPKAAQVMAVSGAGEPVLLRHRYGSGEVWLSTPDFLVTGSSTPADRLGFFADLFRDLKSVSPVTVTGTEGDDPAPDVSWIAATQRPDLVVVAANHGKVPQDVRFALPNGERRTATIAPECVAVIRFANARR